MGSPMGALQQFSIVDVLDATTFQRLPVVDQTFKAPDSLLPDQVKRPVPSLRADLNSIQDYVSERTHKK